MKILERKIEAKGEKNSIGIAQQKKIVFESLCWEKIAKIYRRKKKKNWYFHNCYSLGNNQKQKFLKTNVCIPSKRTVDELQKYILEDF